MNDVSISAQKDGNLMMDATARTFRYLSDDEANAQRKAAAHLDLGTQGFLLHQLIPYHRVLFV